MYIIQLNVLSNLSNMGSRFCAVRYSFQKHSLNMTNLFLKDMWKADVRYAIKKKRKILPLVYHPQLRDKLFLSDKICEYRLTCRHLQTALRPILHLQPHQNCFAQPLQRYTDLQRRRQTYTTDHCLKIGTKIREINKSQFVKNIE